MNPIICHVERPIHLSSAKVFVRMVFACIFVLRSCHTSFGLSIFEKYFVVLPDYANDMLFLIDC